MTPREKLASGRVRTFEYMPYLASYIYALKQSETPGSGTCSVSKDGVIHWDPAFIESIDTNTAAYVFIHEALHLIFRHFSRAQAEYGERPSEQQRFVMNVAGDLVIEQTMSALRALRPKDAVHLGCTMHSLGGIVLDFPQNLDMIAYYKLIMARLAKPPQAPPQEQPSSGGTQQQPQQGPSAPSVGTADQKRPQGKDGKQGSKQGKSNVAAACDPSAGGSAGDGVQRDYEVPDPSWDAFGEMISAGFVDRAVREAEMLAPGTVPGQLRQALEVFLRPQPDPFEHLRSLVASSTAAPLGGRLATYRRLSRKQPADMCRLRGQLTTQATAVVIVDTSGSMGDRETKERALTVIADGLRKLKSVKVVCADTRIRSSATLREVKNFVWHGGGGTAMDVAIQQVDKDDHPDSIVLITDAATGWPRRQPRARVVVALTCDSFYARNIPRWCKTVPLFSKGGDA